MTGNDGVRTKGPGTLQFVVFHCRLLFYVALFDDSTILKHKILN